MTVAGQPFVVTGTATLTVADDTLTICGRIADRGRHRPDSGRRAAANALAVGLSRSFALTGLPFTVTERPSR